MKKTKIIATMGPATDSEEMIEELIKSGVNVFRLNFSHGDHEYHAEVAAKIKKIREKLAEPVAILADLQGPKIRVGEVERDLRRGDVAVLNCGRAKSDEIQVQYANLYKDVQPGDRILLDDGLLDLKVTAVGNKIIKCRVLNGGHLSSKKGINLPTGTITADVLTKKDRKDADLAIALEADFIALSFVKNAKDVRDLRKIIDKKKSKAKIVTKIERHEAVNNLDEIIAEADAVMVARGDLGVELPAQDVPIIQKRIIRKCLSVGKPCIVATQMLDSMIRNPRSTRAETSDIANAILDGADAIMLSGETSVGKYPREAVRAMRNIALNTEEWMIDDNIQIGRRISRDVSQISEAVASGVNLLSKETGSKFIIAGTASGNNARQISKYRPHAQIIAVTDSETVLRQLALSWGIQPMLNHFSANSELVIKMDKYLVENKMVKKGDRITFVSGLTKGHIGGTNLIQIHEVN